MIRCGDESDVRRRAKVFMCLGGNFLMAASDTEYTAKGIQNCDLTVQVSTKLNRTHLVMEKRQYCCLPMAVLKRT